MTCISWTAERVAWLKGFAPGHNVHQIADEFERLWGVRPSVSSLKNAKVAHGARSYTNAGQFRKGCAGGFKDENHKRRFLEAGKDRRFKKGQMPHNGHQPIGTERVDAKDGYIWVKVAQRKDDPKSAHDNWKPKHYIVYEQHNGPIPPGCNIVFADRDKRNFDPGNLVAVPRGLWAIISKKRMAYSDADSLRSCMAVAELDRAVHAAECAPRACRACGAEFRPRFARQRTCDACLGR